MRRPWSIAGVAALTVVSLSAAAWAADSEDRPGSQPQRSTEERPFGGPPPRALKPKKQGKTCKFVDGACELEKARPVGSTCSCSDGGRSGGQGKVE
jgi:hypothetical protein